jgi:predicted transcriptional regulator
LKSRGFFEIPVSEGLIKTSTLRAMVEILEENGDIYANAFLNGFLMVIGTTIDTDEETLNKVRNK